MNIQTSEDKEVMFKDIKPAEVFVYKGSVLMKLKSRYSSYISENMMERAFNAIHLHNADTEFFDDYEKVVRVDHTLKVSI